MIGLLTLVGGLLLLVVGGDFLVKGAVNIAYKFKISPLVVGMTIVSFGTSAPELLVSVNAAIGGNPDIAIGNVVGSNIANIALVLGITVLIFPIIIDRQTKVMDWPMMMLSTLLFVVVAWDFKIVLWEGVLLFSVLLAFIVLLIRKSRGNYQDDEVEDKQEPFYKAILFLLAGCVGLYFGSEWFVGGAVSIAESLEMSQKVIAVTVVAFGTSAPELVASCVAAYRQQTDISIGNLIGSNIFNIMAVLGITSMVREIPIDASVETAEMGVMDFDVFWMVGIALMLFPMLFLGRRFGRIKGVILLCSYVTYITLLVLIVKNII